MRQLLCKNPKMRPSAEQILKMPFLKVLGSLRCLRGSGAGEGGSARAKAECQQGPILLKGTGCCVGHLGTPRLLTQVCIPPLPVYRAGSCGAGARDGAGAGAAASAGGAVARRRAAEGQPCAGRRVGGQVGARGGGWVQCSKGGRRTCMVERNGCRALLILELQKGTVDSVL